ncbi:hypothetical protein [Nocardia sp. NPDC051463]|uniref:hypothetical protein n=1 Tax=Nocardia sp. NPDC051463 TaxID=3154845 RepID=UPI00343383C1
MKKLIVVAAVTAGLLTPAGLATAEPAAAPNVAASSAASTAAPIGSLSEDIFCAVIRFLKGGWAGRPADCSF